jgi:hypothetical protein
MARLLVSLFMGKDFDFNKNLKERMSLLYDVIFYLVDRKNK